MSATLIYDIDFIAPTKQCRRWDELKSRRETQKSLFTSYFLCSKAVIGETPPRGLREVVKARAGLSRGRRQPSRAATTVRAHGAPLPGRRISVDICGIKVHRL